MDDGTGLRRKRIRQVRLPVDPCASIPADDAPRPPRPTARHCPARARGPAPVRLLAPLPDRGSVSRRAGPGDAPLPRPVRVGLPGPGAAGRVRGPGVGVRGVRHRPAGREPPLRQLRRRPTRGLAGDPGRRSRGGPRLRRRRRDRGARGLRPAHRRRARGHDPPRALDGGRAAGGRPTCRPPPRVARARRRGAHGARRDPGSVWRALPRRGAGRRALHGPRARRGGLRGETPTPSSSSPTTGRSWTPCGIGPSWSWSRWRGRSHSPAWPAWPADIVSWTPGPDLPALADGHARLAGAALGGLEPRALRDDPPATAVGAARAALAGVGGRGLVVGAGGPVWPDTPDEVLAAVIRGLGGSTRPILGLAR